MKERKLEVFMGEYFVGTLAETADRCVTFAYSDERLGKDVAISPFSLQVEPKEFVPSSQHFQGWWAVFADSPTNAWGRLLVDRMLKEHGVLPADVMQLERLAIVGDSGLDTLTYHPAWDVHQNAALTDPDGISAAQPKTSML